MTRSRAPRLVRGAVAASLATFVALLSHIAAGGTVPGVVGILVPWILAVAVSTLLAGRTLSLARLGIAVAASQLLFHALFVLGLPSSRAQPHSAFHVHDYALTSAASGGVHVDVAMWIGHVLAAVVTIAVLYRGERAVRALHALGRDLLHTLRRRIVVVLPVAPQPHRLGRPRLDVHVIAPLSRHDAVVARRGPPLLLPV